MVLTVSLFDESIFTVDPVSKVDEGTTCLWEEKNCQEVLLIVMVTRCFLTRVGWVEVFHVL